FFASFLGHTKKDEPPRLERVRGKNYISPEREIGLLRKWFSSHRNSPSQGVAPGCHREVKAKVGSPSRPGTGRPTKIRVPAPGFRYEGTGTLRLVGGNGYSWEASVTTGDNAYTLFFTSGSIRPSYSNNRATGLQLRCLQE
ncbi:MAG: hypothetical protein K2G93_02085, partial [Rikenella sp.]|nr:hypothetical protein [Rikenella sp.]